MGSSCQEKSRIIQSNNSNNVKNKFFNIRCINLGSLLTRQTSSCGVSASVATLILDSVFPLEFCSLLSVKGLSINRKCL